MKHLLTIICTIICTLSCTISRSVLVTMDRMVIGQEQGKSTVEWVPVEYRYSDPNEAFQVVKAAKTRMDCKNIQIYLK